jgi:DNA gyrase subunit A
MRRFNLDEVQAQAILDMPLRRLAGLERKKIEDEHKEVTKRIKELRSLLKSPKLMRSVVIDELKAVREHYADPRRTQIIQMEEGETAIDRLTTTEMMPEKHVWVAVTSNNRIARTDDDKSFRQWGIDAPKMVLRTTTHHTLFLVAENGEAAALSVQALPVANDPEKGALVSAIAPFGGDHHPKLIFSVPLGLSEADGFLLSVSKLGMIKRSLLSELPGPSANLITLVKINPKDELVSLLFTRGNQDIYLASQFGMGIRFSEEEARPMGLVAAGVNGIKLRAGDAVIGGGIAAQRGEILLVTNRGRAKRLTPAQFPIQGRYGYGVITWKLPENEKVIGTMMGLLTANGVLHFKDAASRLVRVTDAPSCNRTQRGEVIIEVKANDEILEMTIPLDMLSFF